MLFPDTVSIEKRTSTDASHKSTYGTAKTVKCNLQAGLQILRSPDGDFLVSSAWIGFPPGTDVEEGDRITLPDSSQPRITSVAAKRNDYTKRVVYIEVYCTRSVPAGSVV